MKILYDWRGMPVEFRLEPTGSSGNSLFRLTMAYDGAGRRISKTRWVKSANSQDWEKELETHYTGIGTEIRESFTGANAETKVVVNMPNGLGRYGIEDAAAANANASKNFEWYLKNLLGSTMLVYGTVASTNPNEADVGARISAYDYRSFGEMVELTPPPTDKVTENFTGKEYDDEIALDYFGARYLDPMLGMWISVDPARQFASPYLYAGNGMNPVNGVDPDGNKTVAMVGEDGTIWNFGFEFDEDYSFDFYMPDGSIETVLEPPHSSYLYSFNNKGIPNVIGAKVDFNMEYNANEMIENVNFYEPLEWYSNKKYDFKNQYYRNNVYTVGVFKGIAMTARDVGNALWAGYTKYTYFFNAAAIASGLAGPMAPIVWKMYSEMGPKAMNFISNTTAGGKEDNSSAVMQKWGYENYNPWW